MKAVPEPKLRALRERLEEQGSVTFRSGATVEVERRYVVTTPLGARMTYTERELPAAYRLAEVASATLEQAREDAELDARFGKAAPF